MKASAPPGTFDLLPEKESDLWQSTYLWSYVEDIVRQTALQFGFREIRTPLFERTEVFVRGVGETTDIVSKEMYTFDDRGGRSLTLRPEGTAPVMRAFAEHHLDQKGGVQKFFYIAPMFRYERKQAGRYRQHHQFGAEAIGIGTAEQDVEVIDLVMTVYKRLGLKGLEVQINSLGSDAARQKYRDELRKFLEEFKECLSEESKNRLLKNPLRIFDSKDPEDLKILETAPSLYDFLDEESKTHFKKVQELLHALAIPFRINPRLVRGLDYYNKTVFEVTVSELGAHNSICGGGRYDGLLQTLGGADLPCCGFGAGLERIIQTMIAQKAALPEPPAPLLYLIPLGDAAKKECFSILHQLRTHGIEVEMDLSERKLSKSLQAADAAGARYVAVIGDDELKRGAVEIKHMESKETWSTPITSLVRILEFEKKSRIFIELWQEMDKPFKDPSEREFFLARLSNSILTTQKISTNLQTALHEIQQLL